MQLMSEEERRSGSPCELCTMRPRIARYLACILVGTLAGVALGALAWYPEKQGIRVYQVGEHRIAYDSDWPTYGLPLPEYSTTYLLLAKGDCAKARHRLSVLYKRTLSDAQNRLLEAPPRDRKVISQVIAFGERYMALADSISEPAETEEE